MHAHLRRSSVPASRTGAANMKEGLDASLQQLREACTAHTDTVSFRVETRVEHKLGPDVLALIEGDFEVFDLKICRKVITLRELRRVIGFGLQVRLSKRVAILERAERISKQIENLGAFKGKTEFTTWKTSLCAYMSALGVSTPLVLSSTDGVGNWPSILYTLKRNAKIKEQRKLGLLKSKPRLESESEDERKERNVREILQRTQIIMKGTNWTARKPNGQYLKQMSAMSERELAEKIWLKWRDRWRGKVQLKPDNKVS